MSKQRYLFAAMPLRALGDPRLSGADFRILGIISHFDRFSKNGSGCYATQQTMSERTGLAVPTISTSIRKLCELGYLEKSRQENRRRFQYRVIHDPSEAQQADPNTSANGEVSEDDTSANGEVSDPNTSSTAETKIFP